jgi:hypothetical protein
MIMIQTPLNEKIYLQAAQRGSGSDTARATGVLEHWLLNTPLQYSTRDSGTMVRDEADTVFSRQSIYSFGQRLIPSDLSSRNTLLPAR